MLDLAHLAQSLTQPGETDVQASQVAAAVASTVPGCLQNPQTFQSLSEPACNLLGGVVQLASGLGQNGPQSAGALQDAAVTLYEQAGCGPPSSQPLDNVASVQALACALVQAVGSGSQEPAGLQTWDQWLHDAASCQSATPLTALPQALVPVVNEVPELAVALGASIPEACSLAMLLHVVDQQCQASSSTSTTTSASAVTLPATPATPVGSAAPGDSS